MNDGRPDRRVTRTRRALHEALIELILEKGYDNVTVGDIVDRADVGRSTFYAHFVDKDALLLGGFPALPAFRAGGVHGPDTESPTLFEFSLPMFRHANDERRLVRALVGQRSGALVLRQLDGMLSELVRADLVRHHLGARDERLLEVAVRFVVGSYVALLTWWQDHPTTATPEEMDETFRGLVLAGVTGFFEGAPGAVASPAGQRR